MALRPAVLITAVALSALALGGCSLLPAAPTNATAKPTPTISETPAAEEPDVVLPPDTVLSLSMRATSDTGAAVDILLVLLKPEPIGTDGAAPRAAATLDWCVDEVDQSVLESGSGFSFAELDVTVTPVAGTPVWPADLPLHILPGEGEGATLATGGAAYQVERPNELNEEAFYVPHCAQDAFLSVPGSGALYLGWGDDGTTLDDWLGTQYGATFDSWGEPVNPDQATLTECTAVITDLGKSMGASDGTFTEFFSDTQCILSAAA